MASSQGSRSVDLALLAASREADDTLRVVEGWPGGYEPEAPAPYRSVHPDWPLIICTGRLRPLVKRVATFR